MSNLTPLPYMNSADIVNAEEWRAATAPASRIRQSWRREVVRHNKIVAFYESAGLQAGPNSENYKKTPRSGKLPYHPLHCAASQGMVVEARLILDESVSHQGGYLVDIPDTSGCCPLHWAAIMGHTEVITLLLRRGAQIDNRDPAGRTPLFSSSAFGALGAVRILIENGADPNVEDSRGLTPLHAAAAGGHLQVAITLLSACADHRRRCSVGATPRHLAERQGHVAMAKLLTASAARREGGNGQLGGDVREIKADVSFLPQLRRDSRSVAQHHSSRRGVVVNGAAC